MDSPHAFAPSDEELLHFTLDGEALPAEKRAHLEQCTTCQQHLAEIRQLNDSLVARFYRRICPSGMQISLYCEGQLTADELLWIATHLLDCHLCSAEVADTRRFMREAPVWLEAASSPFASVRRVNGVLTGQQAQFVSRDIEGSTVPDIGWPRLYRAGSITLSLYLKLSRNGDHLLIGILTGAGSEKSVDMFEGAGAELFEGSLIADLEQDPSREPILWTLIDDLGNLDFPAVPTGEYVLVLHLPGQDVVFEHITIE